MPQAGSPLAARPLHQVLAHTLERSVAHAAVRRDGPVLDIRKHLRLTQVAFGFFTGIVSGDFRTAIGSSFSRNARAVSPVNPVPALPA
jgi:hypothetical protein